SLSAVVSRNDPSRELTFHRRASRPSNQSVLAATANTIAAGVQEWPSTRPITTGVATIRALVPASIRLPRALPLRAVLSARGSTATPILPARLREEPGSATEGLSRVGRVDRPPGGLGSVGQGHGPEGLLDLRNQWRCHAELADPEPHEQDG